MNAPNEPPTPESADLPRPRVAKARGRLLLIWLVPVAAAIAVGFYLLRFRNERGVEIAITFDDASGLRVRETQLTYHGVNVGSVSRLDLTEDRNRAVVYVRVENKFADTIVRDGGRFWLVRPDLGGGMLTGLSTVISGPYIDCEPGQGNTVTRFEGNDSRPVLLGDGLRVILRTDRLAHLQIESPVYYRGMQVGAVQDIRFGQDATHVNVTVFIWQRYAKLLRRGSRFWGVSGTDIKGGVFSGISVEVNNLKALVAGGVAFATPENTDPRPVPEGSQYTLHDEADKEWLAWSAKIDLPLDQNPGMPVAQPTPGTP